MKRCLSLPILIAISLIKSCIFTYSPRESNVSNKLVLMSLFRMGIRRNKGSTFASSRHSSAHNLAPRVEIPDSPYLRDALSSWLLLPKRYSTHDHRPLPPCFRLWSESLGVAFLQLLVVCLYRLLEHRVHHLCFSGSATPHPHRC